jgi:phosphopantothenoylcysteine decarboxylase / phosphopantothenate---cysteine ligase
MSPPDSPARAPRPHVLFQLSGSIAAYKACQVVSRLTQAGCDVQTVATHGALQFVGPATLEGLTGRPVETDTFAPRSQMDHIHLVRWADVIVLCPATANTINRLAAGVADDLVGTMFLAHDFTKPYVVVPAMNAAMYQHPATAASLDRLRGWGLEILDPDDGSLACGEIGPGRLAEPDAILARLLELVAARPPVERALRVLITAGGTKVPIDGVRAITNTSTGSTGAAIAEHLAQRGHDITLLHAANAVLPTSDAIRRHPFVTFDDLEAALRSELAQRPFDAVIHLAAVSDYDVHHVVVDGESRPANPGGKLGSGRSIEIHLRSNPKLLPQLRDFAGRQDIVVVGFKLTNGADADERAAAIKTVARNTDLVVHNDATEMTGERHPATIYRGEEVVASTDDNASLAAALERAVLELATS